MSSAGQASREWRFHVQDMIVFCQRVLSYTDGMDQNTFVNNSLVYDATLRNLDLIGEAATQIPDTAREAHPEIPWPAIIGTRNRVIHAYLGIDDDIPAMLPDLHKLLEMVE